MAIQLTTAREAATLHGLKMLVFGQPGAGKTVLSTTANAPTLILSAEAGLLSIRATDIPVINITSLDALDEAYAYVTSGDGQQFDWIVLDSISEIGEQVLSRAKQVNKDPRKAFGELADQMMVLLKAFRDLPEKHVLMTAKQQRAEDDTGRMYYRPGLPGQQLSQGVGYLFDEVFCLRAEKNADGELERWLQTQPDGRYEAKDRSGELDEYEPPNLEHIANKILQATTVAEAA